MSNAVQDSALSFDDILEAVKDTARGRWFLEGFENRLRNGNMNRIMDAIGRLEERIEYFAQNDQDAHLVKKAREAIAQARRDIAQIENKPGNLSTEAQLFARLASQAKTAFASQPAEGQGIARALSLVQDLDREFNSQVQIVAPESASAPAMSNLFQPDEAIFEAAPAMEAVATAPAEPMREAGARGAKLVIHKLSAVAHVPALEPVAEVEAAPAAEAQAQEEQPAHSRIVVVRRAAGEEANVPLLEEAAESAVSAA
ncbi:hypothetical protein [Aestuariivirga litoralis]|uniref:hypothetical protein n=1 Tax=Aestuariivirga litoralis TaxID=2650924 RepID=UPI0018C7A173|nr:hypothetical protein [Aestuariivirga litoralis]MBG1233027.1 hypothetical protein [Aestuariivirga litoralis]